MCGQSQAPSPSPSCAQHSDADVESPGAAMPQTDTAVNIFEASVGQSNANVNLFDIGMPPAGTEVDPGDPSKPDSEEVWDSDTSLETTQLDGNESDGGIEIKDMLPEGTDEEGQSAMVNLMAKLENCDPQDFEWLPPKERKKIVPRKTGMISF